MSTPAEAWTLRFTAAGAVLGHEPRADAELRPTAAGGLWVEGSGGPGRQFFRDQDTATLVLESAGEKCTASSTEPLGETGGVYYLLLADGRLFRLAPRGTRPGGFVLTGWDTPGPYLIARPDSVGWSLETQPAGRDLEGLRTLMFLVATRIVEDGRAGGNEQP